MTRTVWKFYVILALLFVVSIKFRVIFRWFYHQFLLPTPSLPEYDQFNAMIVMLSFFFRVLSILVEFGRLSVLSNNYLRCVCVQIEVRKCIPIINLTLLLALSHKFPLLSHSLTHKLNAVTNMEIEISVSLVSLY